MPNWCNNHLEFKCNKADFDKFRLHELQFKNILPCPEELTACSAPNSDNPEDMISKYGCSDWYNWCIQNWGCKWDIEPSESVYSEENGIVSGTVAFETAWCPPIELYKYMEELGIMINATFFEGGMCFFGSYCEGSEDTSNFESYDDIPEDIAETFGIKEHDYESDESDIVI